MLIELHTACQLMIRPSHNNKIPYVCIAERKHQPHSGHRIQLVSLRRPLSRYSEAADDFLVCLVIDLPGMEGQMASRPEHRARMETTKSKKKILIIGRPKSGKLSLVKALTSSFPSGLTDESTPHSGLIHSITLTTPYFSTEAGIWIDEIPEDSELWLDEYLSEEATPVLQSLAAIMLTVAPGEPSAEQDIKILRKLNDRGDQVDWDATTLVIGRKSPNGGAYSSLLSLCDDHTLEFINLNESGKNEFGGSKLFFTDDVDQVEKQGLPRVLEVLHTCDWTSSPSEDDESMGSLQDGELEFELRAFGDDLQEEDKQIGSEHDVEYMERMMTMLLSARGSIATAPYLANFIQKWVRIWEWRRENSLHVARWKELPRCLKTRN